MPLWGITSSLTSSAGREDASKRRRRPGAVDSSSALNLSDKRICRKAKVGNVTEWGRSQPERSLLRRESELNEGSPHQPECARVRRWGYYATMALRPGCGDTGKVRRPIDHR